MSHKQYPSRSSSPLVYRHKDSSWECIFFFFTFEKYSDDGRGIARGVEQSGSYDEEWYSECRCDIRKVENAGGGRRDDDSTEFDYRPIPSARDLRLVLLLSSLPFSCIRTYLASALGGPKGLVEPLAMKLCSTTFLRPLRSRPTSARRQQNSAVALACRCCKRK